MSIPISPKELQEPGNAPSQGRRTLSPGWWTVLTIRCSHDALAIHWSVSRYTHKKNGSIAFLTPAVAAAAEVKKKQRPRRSTETAEYPSGQSIGLRCKSMAVFYHRCLTVDVSTTSKRPTKRPEELPDGRTLTSHRLYTTLMCSSNKNEKYSLK